MLIKERGKKMKKYLGLKSLIMFGIVAICLFGCASVDVIDEYVEPAECLAEDSMTPKIKSKKLLNSQNTDGAMLNSAIKLETERKIAYEFYFDLQTFDIQKVQQKLQNEAKKFGGYMLSLDNKYLTLKIPKAKAEAFLDSCKKAGTIVNLNMNGTDMTDTITDLEMRLASQKKMQKRLLELLDKATKVEDMLKIEVQLNKVESEIERISARLANSNKQVDFVTFTIQLCHIEVSEREAIALGKFAFLRKLVNYNGGKKDSIDSEFELPSNFVSYSDNVRGNKDTYSAVSADDCILAISTYEINKDSTFDFWVKLIERSLKVYHKCHDIKATASNELLEIQAITTKRGVEDNYYFASFIVDGFWGSKELCTIEFFGEKEAFEKHLESVKNMVKNRLN